MIYLVKKNKKGGHLTALSVLSFCREALR